MSNIKVGLQLYSVRDAMEKDFEGTLKAVKEMGYDYVEFAGYFGKSAEEVKAVLDKYELTAISVHQGPTLFDEEGQKAVDYIKTLGVKYAAVPWYEASKLAGTAEWDNTVAMFTRVGKLLADNGIQMMYHNHDFEFEKFDGKYLFDWIYETMPFINPEIDVCWVHYAGEDPCKIINQYNGKVQVVHFKDFVCEKLGGGPVYALINDSGEDGKKASKEDNGFKFTPVGQGCQNFDAIIKMCEACKTEYVIVEQDSTYEIPSLEACRMSREYLKTKGL